MTEIEAISVLQTRIKYPKDDTYGGMCEAEYQQEAIDLAIEALKEKAEREKPLTVKISGESPDGTIRYSCPNCGRLFWDCNYVENFCPKYGSKLEVANDN